MKVEKYIRDKTLNESIVSNIDTVTVIIIWTIVWGYKVS